MLIDRVRGFWNQMFECPLDRHKINKADILKAPRYFLSGINEKVHFN
jgi:hypothetical protein